MLQSWFGVEEEEEGGEYVWREGWERIPLNWVSTLPYIPYLLRLLSMQAPFAYLISNMRKKQYKRPIEYPYDNAYFLADAANAAALHPKFLNIGGLVLTSYSSSHLFITNH